MNLGVVGSRDWPYQGWVGDRIWMLREEHGFDTVVSGGARGVDTMAENSGRALGMRVISYKVVELGDSAYGIDRVTFDPDNGFIDHDMVLRSSGKGRVFHSFGRAAFYRNGLIVRDSDGVVAFWNGRSNGTRDSIEKSTALGNLLEVIRG